MRNKIKKIICICFIGIFLISINASAINITYQANEIKDIRPLKKSIIKSNHDYTQDIEPYGDLKVTVTIKQIRAYDKIDIFSNPDFYVKIDINGEKFQTPTWHNQKYVSGEWSYTADIPENQENVSITIQLWDWNPVIDRLCDISNNFDGYGKNNYYAKLIYNTKNGHWCGTDYNYPDSIPSDVSGYGRLNGCDDNTYNKRDRDCELVFDITQTDPDGDGIPSWVEEEIYGTNPEVDNTGWDNDSDGVPIEWEFKWGHGSAKWGDYWHEFWFFDPFEWEDHKNMDIDKDGLDNVEEYLTSQWGSDPFHQDIFLELDQMEVKGNKGNYVSQLAKDMLIDAFGKHNIAFHIDDHEEDAMDGGELIPFQETVNGREGARFLRMKYFLNENPTHWRRGVFHYAVIVYQSEGHKGFAFDRDSFLMNITYCDKMSDFTLWNIGYTKVLNTKVRRALVYASIMMHETGHVLGIHHGNTEGCDNTDTYLPWQSGWWKWANYKSCMNYRYVQEIVDYSDGTHGKNDFNDWARIDLTRFQD